MKAAEVEEITGETQEQKIDRRAARVNKHLVLRKNYNDYLVSLFSEDPRVLIDRYYPAASEGREVHPSRKGALDALDAMEKDAQGKNQAERNDLTLKFIEDQIVAPIAYFMFMLVTEQETKWANDMKGTGPMRDVNKSYDYTLTDMDLDNVFRYYLGDLAAATATFTGTQEEIQAQINDYKAKHDPLVRQVEANENVSEDNEFAPLIKFGLSGYLGDWKALVDDYAAKLKTAKEAKAAKEAAEKALNAATAEEKAAARGSFGCCKKKQMKQQKKR